VTRDQGGTGFTGPLRGKKLQRVSKTKKVPAAALEIVKEKPSSWVESGDPIMPRFFQSTPYHQECKGWTNLDRIAKKERLSQEDEIKRGKDVTAKGSKKDNAARGTEQRNLQTMWGGEGEGGLRHPFCDRGLGKYEALKSRETI